MLEEPPNQFPCQEKILVSLWLYMSGPNLYLSCVWQSDAGFDVKACDLYFKTLVDVFTNHISAELYRMDRTQDLNLQIGTKLFGNHSYPWFPSSCISLPSKSYVNIIFTELNITNCKDKTAQTFIYYWIYSGTTKVFRKRKFDFSCHIKMFPFEGLL